VVLSNGNTVVGTADGYLTYTAPNFVQLAACCSSRLAQLGQLWREWARLYFGKPLICLNMATGILGAAR
ncbi:MAG TPA: hypothetical protein VLZ56_07870, partial [Mycoplana sp.]|nr:hypothetical protein [Mycoplana sp.]